MHEALFISYQDAALLYGLSYSGFVNKVARDKQHSKQFKLRKLPGENGGIRMQVDVFSLPPEIQRKYKAEHPETFAPVNGWRVQDEANERPWYAQGNYETYLSYKRQYPKNAARAEWEHTVLQEYLAYESGNRTAFALETAKRLHIEKTTLYAHVKLLQTAMEWNAIETARTGTSHACYEYMALCQKPREKNTFPKLTEDMRKIIKRVFYDRNLTTNRAPMTAKSAVAWKKLEASGIPKEALPSDTMLIEYFKWTLKDPINRAALQWQSCSEREWNNHYSVKGRNDTTGLMYLEHVQGDGHTLDFWSCIVDRNGVKRAVRLDLVTWIDVRTRRIVGYEVCYIKNSEVIARSLLSVIYSPNGGVPKVLHIDNGKEYTAEWLIGQSRKEREDNGAEKGLYKLLGVVRYSRSI